MRAGTAQVKKLLAAALVLLSACSPGPYCATLCGAVAVGTNNCTTLQRAEDKAVITYDTALYADTCRSLNGWMIEVERDEEGNPLEHWTDEWQRDVYGLTYCDKHVVKLGNDAWRLSAYAHEVLHVTRCGKNVNDVDHEGWVDAGFYQLIDSAR